jgi:hypothetical protein
MKKVLLILPFILFFISGCSFFPSITKDKFPSNGKTNQNPACESAPQSSNETILESTDIQDEEQVEKDPFNVLGFKIQEIVDNQVINSKEFKWNNSVYTFKHYCYGLKEQINVEGSPDWNKPFCLGKNTLSITKDNNKELFVQSDNVQRADLAPVLLDIELIPSKSGRVNALVTYFPETCATLYYCGAGMPSNYISHVLDLKTLNFKRLENFPHSISDNFKSIWNVSGDKLLVVPQTCGGAGCHESPLIGYDLDLDKIIYESKEKGSEDGFSTADGTPNHYWKSVRWLSDDKAVAELVAPTGYIEKIDVSF